LNRYLARPRAGNFLPNAKVGECRTAPCGAAIANIPLDSDARKAYDAAIDKSLVNNLNAAVIVPLRIISPQANFLGSAYDLYQGQYKSVATSTAVEKAVSTLPGVPGVVSRAIGMGAGGLVEE
jgi:hypothetical protein